MLMNKQKKEVEKKNTNYQTLNVVCRRTYLIAIVFSSLPLTDQAENILR